MYILLYIYIYISPLCARVSNGFLVLGYSLVFVVWPQIKKKREKNQREKS